MVESRAMRDFAGRVAVVTGAASGIGRALAHAFADRGCDIALVDVNGAGLAEAAGEVRQLGRRTSVHVVDVANRMTVAYVMNQMRGEGDVRAARVIFAAHAALAKGRA